MSKPARKNVLPMQQDSEKKHPVPTDRTAPAKAKKRLNFRNLFLLAFMTWAAYVFFFVQSPDIDRLNQDQAQLNSEIKLMQETNQELQKKIEQLNDPDYIAEIARKKYLMVKEGETLFLPPKQ
ncbi:FtsB family cell division protein [Tumebacillus lipolyticus]|uniref:Septum formation initiator family protein n=1 Tax=Tumebacillus lipolyticus TaxID=1280370 RepID=A0ABW4ZZB0_9BACL